LSASSPLPEIASDRPPVVVAEGLSKRYDLGQSLSLNKTARTLLRRREPTDSTFDALKSVDFAITAGECFGIVGTNGAGKSTILQLLTGITVPSSGSITVRGRVMPLLAVGTGFHPELTGRENILLFATILGVPRKVALERTPDVAAFAGIGAHLDTPNKRYSDGMQARLSFAIAMLFPADIYLFDEVLAVVDGDFRDHCLDEIRRLRDLGRTVIFVSHQTRQVRELCDRVMWLDAGEVRQIGLPADVLDAYEHHAAADEAAAVE
jgi:ABC-type polysaccharide/polyol phosphate transport system ATPase subunit